MDVYRIEVDQLEPLAGLWDAAVDKTPGADPFCASSLWVFPAARSFEEAEPPVVVSDGHSFVGLRARHDPEHGRLLLGLDPIWGFATPVVGHPIIGARLLDVRLRMDDFAVAVIAGQHDQSQQTAALVHVLGDRWQLHRGGTEARLRADLTSGFDAWFSRRSGRFRQRLRRIEREAAEAGIEVVDLSGLAPSAVMERVLGVEEASWKGAEGTGLIGEDLSGFVTQVVHRLTRCDQLRLMVAVRGGEDLGYVLGGVRARTYRGLQLAHRADASGASIGHLLQLHQIRALEGTGIDTYDLGMDIEYKRRWADRVDETFSVLITPQS